MGASKTKRIGCFITVVTLLLGVCLWLVPQKPSEVPAIRHVVLISLDTTRADHLSCYGYPGPRG